MALAFCGLGFNAFAESNPGGSFELIERLGANWSKERVRFPLTGRALNQAIAGATLIDDAGRAVPHEMVMDAAGSAVEFLVDLPAFSRRSFRFALVPEATGRGVVVEEKPGVILLTNGLAGVAIRKGDQDGLLPAVILMICQYGWWLCISLYGRSLISGYLL